MQTFIVRTFCDEYTISCSNINAAVSEVLNSYSNPDTATVKIYGDCANIFFDNHLEATVDTIYN